jgi:negative regulator of sigma E activity
MSTADEYHQFARESLQAAAQAKTEEERHAFLQMAQTWTAAATQLAARAPVTMPKGLSS